MNDDTKAIVASNLTLAYFHMTGEIDLKRPDPTNPGMAHTVPETNIDTIVKRYKKILEKL